MTASIPFHVHDKAISLFYDRGKELNKRPGETKRRTAEGRRRRRRRRSETLKQYPPTHSGVNLSLRSAVSLAQEDLIDPNRLDTNRRSPEDTSGGPSYYCASVIIMCLINCMSSEFLTTLNGQILISKSHLKVIANISLLVAFLIPPPTTAADSRKYLKPLLPIYIIYIIYLLQVQLYRINRLMCDYDHKQLLSAGYRVTCHGLADWLLQLPLRARRIRE